MDHPDERARLVEQAHRYLEEVGRPRLVMLCILAVTLTAGFLSSVAMVHLGVERMPIRYPIAVAVAYATFLGMLRAWLGHQSIAAKPASDPEGLLLPASAALGVAVLADEPAEAEEEKPRQQGSGGTFDFGDPGEGCGALVVLLLIAVACTLIVSVYLMATSPLLLAELLVDGVLLGAMTKAVSPNPPPHWSRAAIRRTWLAALITAVVFGLVGLGVETVVPGARTFGEAWAIDHGRR